MGSSSTDPPASQDFLVRFRECAGPGATLSFADFMALALYDAKVGYYRRHARRIGYSAGSDFFTASTSGPIFGELVSAACQELLGGDSRAYAFVEIGAEQAGGVLAGVNHPFGSARTIALGEPISLAGKCIVFSNELFDAQPFRRFVFRDGCWHERFVTLREGRLAEIELRCPEPPHPLPKESAPGYMVDAPFAAAALAKKIAAQNWTGLFVAADYGKSWQEIGEAAPSGTARAYYRHTQANDLLARPGEQDLTCHICWDWLVEALQAEDFTSVAVESQEAFFIRHAGEYIAAASSADAAHLTRRKLALMQLLHPAHLGQKFQVLHGRRG
jgi:SAM-dependent MidA family methyltransferase